MYKNAYDEKINNCGDGPVNEVRIKVRFGETDLAGIVHHSNFFHWFELGRFDLMDKFFNCEEDFKDNFFPVVKSKCCYISSAFFNQELIIRTYIKKQLSTKLVFYYSIVDIKNPKKVIAIAATEHVCIVDKKSIRLKWPEEISSKIENCMKVFPYVFIDGREYEKKL